MKLPRWFAISLLTISAFAILGTAAWLWITWPERTARRFAELLVARKLTEAVDMLPPNFCFSAGNDFEVHRTTNDWSAATLECGRRAPMDIIRATEEFQVCGRFAPKHPADISAGFAETGFRVKIARGQVIWLASFIRTQSEVILQANTSHGWTELPSNRWRSCRSFRIELVTTQAY
jgi:hypothetical protein